MKHVSFLKIVSTLLVLIAFVSSTLVPTGCANIIPPTGGPRDSLPPRLVSVKPLDSSRNFTGKRVVVEFDEFVQIDNIMENLLVSPTPKQNPVVESKLRTVTINIKDTLEPNTTYTFDFGNAIKDVNEGNIYKNFTYLLSTGPAIDSLKITGKVILAETGKTDSTLIVMLHTSQVDSAVIKDRPRYVARLTPDGSFTFKNLPSGSFALYALKDEGGQRKYMSKAQHFAFLNEPVTPSASPEPITMYAYTEKEEDTATKKPPVPGNTGRNRAPDKKAEQDKRLKVQTNLANNEVDLLGNLELRFETPLKTYDTTKIHFMDDKFTPITNFRYEKDTTDTKIILVHKWTPGTAYNLILDSAFAEDTLGHYFTRLDTLAFTAKKESDYGLVRLRLLGLDLTKNPVLQFVQNDQVKMAYPLTSREFNAKLFMPGEYDLRILFDDNKNGIWDAGKFFGDRRQPEKVMPISRKLTVKANWDNLVDIQL